MPRVAGSAGRQQLGSGRGAHSSLLHVEGGGQRGPSPRAWLGLGLGFGFGFGLAFGFGFGLGLGLGLGPSSRAERSLEPRRQQHRLG